MEGAARLNQRMHLAGAGKCTAFVVHTMHLSLTVQSIGSYGAYVRVQTLY